MRMFVFAVKTCPSPKAPQNGAVICSNDDHVIDTECEFSCLPGHTLVGSRHRSCLPLARWDGLHTTCKHITPPTIKCPENIVVQAEPEEDHAFVNWTVPVSTDNSGLAPAVWTRPSVQLPLKVKIGTMTIVYVASDATHHKSKCNFTITVEDKEPPFVDRCESPPIFLLDSGDNGSLTWDPPLFHDNSGKPIKVMFILLYVYYFYYVNISIVIVITTCYYSSYNQNFNLLICVIGIASENNILEMLS
ncbi:hypothetical protein C0J52_10878 [Blattella germanica]|nr:hypothetical protein C0J52_10878 [Blattella germanica]